MSGKPINTILSRKKSDLPDRRVSWGNYRVREYLTKCEDCSPDGPLLAAEDLISAPLGSDSSASARTPDRTFMNTEDSPEETPLCFSGPWVPLPDLADEESPKQCGAVSFTLTPQCNQLSNSATPHRGIGTPVSIHSSGSRRRLSLSAAKSPKVTSDPFTASLLQDLRKVQSSAIDTVAKMRSAAAVLRARLLCLQQETSHVRERIQYIRDLSDFRLQQNESLMNSKAFDRVETVVDFLRQVGLWRPVAEGAVDTFQTESQFLCRSANLAFSLRITNGPITFGELQLRQRLDSPELQHLADAVLPVFLQHFKQQTLRGTHGFIVDLATFAVDRLLAFFLGFRRLYRDFSVLSCKYEHQKVYTVFTFGPSKRYLASTSPITLESKVHKQKGCVYQLARGLFK